MNLQTPIKLTSNPLNLLHSDHIMAIGSCFVENIHSYMTNLKIKCTSNPAGITFNPHSISKTLNYVVHGHNFKLEEIQFNQKNHFHFDFHGSFNAHSAEAVLYKINQQIENAHEALPSTKCIILTLGTAFVFKHNKSAKIVNNCHKVPASEFERILMAPQQIVDELANALLSIQKINPNIQTIITVSPVRHIRDGLVNNQKSKSHLISAAHSICDQVENCHYFPSYEIMMDELRDYRFYEEDMIHPSKLAVKIILERFFNHHYQKDQREISYQFEKLFMTLNHKPLHPKSKAYLSFLNKINHKTKQLSSQYPYVDLNNEINLIEKRILQFRKE